MSILNTTTGLMPMVQSDSKHHLFNVTSVHHQHHDLNHHSTDPQQIIKAQSSQMTSSSNHVNIDSMMKNYFHITFGDTVLVKGWSLQSTTDVLIACTVFFLLAIFYEGLKSLREFLFRREARSGSYQVSLYTPTNACPDDMIATSVNQSDEHPTPTLINCSMWSKAHFYQSSLHAIQVTISYTLMLGFMTFNTWICLSILLGAGLGYFLFCWRKLTFVNVTDHCN